MRFEQGLGLVGTVKWTAKAAEQIKAGEYKYLSPHFQINEAREVTFILAVALTNTPRIKNQRELMAAAVAAANLENDMTKKKTNEAATATLSLVGPRTKLQGVFKTILGAEVLPDVDVAVEELPEEQVAQLDEVGQAVDALKAAMIEKGVLEEGASTMDVLNAAMEMVGAASGEPADEEASKKIEGEASEVVASLAAKLGLEKGVKASKVLAAFDTMRAATVSVGEHGKVAERLAALELKERTRDAEIFIGTLVDDGKLNPNDNDKMKWARASALDNPKAFETLMAGAPKVWEPGQEVKTDGDGGPKNKRQTIIATAVKEHEQGEREGITVPNVSLNSWVETALQFGDESPLTDAEKKKLTV
jgi:phage I-like protein